MREEIREKAKAAEKKPANFGPDIDLNKYKLKSKLLSKLNCLSSMPVAYKNNALNVGIDLKEKERSGSFFQIDHSVVYSRSKQKGLEIMDISKAMKKYGWIKKYWWKVVPVDADKYTAQAELKQTRGYFIRALPGVKATLPLQACLFISEEGLAQNVHNLIIAEEDSELQIITGCTIASHVRRGLHIGVSEFYVKKNASVIFSMIHSWGPEVEVRPRTAALIEENGTFINNYICLNPVRNLQMFPTAYCIGKNSKARFYNLLYGKKSSLMDIGSKAILKGDSSKAEMTTRAIAIEDSQIIVRGHIVGEDKNSKGHLECRGLLLSDKAKIHSIPELEGKAKGCELSHEAAIGKIREEELCYLMSRGLTEQDAISMIVKGFLDPDIIGLPQPLRNQIKGILGSSVKEF